MRCRRPAFVTSALLAVLGALATPLGAQNDPAPFVSALWLVQRYGTPFAVDPRNDERVKGTLFKALGKEAVLTADPIKELIAPDVFRRIAGADGRLDGAEMRRILEADIPESRRRLLPKVAAHAALLTTSFDMIDAAHVEAGEKLANWILQKYRPGQPVRIVCICTGNSRRSMIGAAMGNVAAAYYGLPEIRFYSGGTRPSAFNSRAITTLREIGIEIEATGKEAPQGEPGTPNPMYRVRWGPAGTAVDSMEAVEFSKMYSDTSNPQQGFAALMVCGDADASCPVVAGAELRVPMHYLDPRIYDGSPYESQKYAERRDDMGRLMLSVLARVRHRFGAAPRPL